MSIEQQAFVDFALEELMQSWLDDEMDDLTLKHQIQWGQAWATHFEDENDDIGLLAVQQIMSDVKAIASPQAWQEANA